MFPKATSVVLAICASVIARADEFPPTMTGLLSKDQKVTYSASERGFSVRIVSEQLYQWTLTASESSENAFTKQDPKLVELADQAVRRFDASAPQRAGYHFGEPEIRFRWMSVKSIKRVLHIGADYILLSGVESDEPSIAIAIDKISSISWLSPSVTASRPRIRDDDSELSKDDDLDAKYLGYAKRIILRSDEDRDGALDASEWESMLLDISPSDQDGDGKVTVQEYARWMQSRAKRSSDETP